MMEFKTIKVQSQIYQYSRNDSDNLLSVCLHRNNMKNNMSAMRDGGGKISSIDTIYVTNMTHSTNGELSRLEESILVFITFVTTNVQKMCQNRVILQP